MYESIIITVTTIIIMIIRLHEQRIDITGIPLESLLRLIKLGSTSL